MLDRYVVREMPGKLPAWALGLIVTGIGAIGILAIGLGLGLGIKKPSDQSGTGSLPLVKPPVQGATPPGLSGNSSNQTTHGMHFKVQTLSAQNIVDRFFNPEGGPTNLFQILTDVDSRIKGINDRIGQFPCMQTVAPVAYTLSTWGTNETFYAQCSDNFQGSLFFDQWAIKSGVFYLFEYSGETSLAARVHNFNSTKLNISVDVWFSVGGINRDGSHAVVQILAQPKEKIFEMTVAGAGIGYCGAQLKSDGVTLRIIGSEDMGATCGAVDSACVSALSIITHKNCTAGVSTFALPAIGRTNFTGAGASQYGRFVFVNPALHDDIDFGPRVPTV
jgi:hypothetical protein